MTDTFLHTFLVIQYNLLGIVIIIIVITISCGHGTNGMAQVVYHFFMYYSIASIAVDLLLPCFFQYCSKYCNFFLKCLI